MAKFVGRKKELEGLKLLLRKRVATLVVVRGRRRIGKSRLTEEFAREFPQSFLLAGVPPDEEVTASKQREVFKNQLRRLDVPIGSGDSWFDLLTDLAKHCQKGRVLVVLDEITWMGGLDPLFLPVLKTVWDLHFKKNPELVLIISGSNSFWIEQKILRSTGFVGRISHYLDLKELPLHRCNEFWGRSGERIASYEKFKLLAVTGGVPRYLEEILPEASAEQNILRLCYSADGLLFHEFDQIFSDLFASRNLIYGDLVRLIAEDKPTMRQLAYTSGRGLGGDLSEYLEDLVEAGFVARDESWNIGQAKEKRLSHYRVCDNYVRFYLKYIDPHRQRIEAGKVSSLPPGWKSIIGLQFENLVCNNRHSLFRALRLNPQEVVWSGPYFQNATTRQQGCQIDYLIQTEHRVLYVCEVKFSDKEVPKSIIAEVKRKSDRLKVPRGFSVRHVLIHVNGVAETVEWDDFFSNIIDFGQFLTMDADD